MDIKTVYRRTIKTLTMIIAASIINIGWHYPASAQPLTFSQNSSQQESSENPLIRDFSKGIRKRMPEHLQRKGIYIENYPGSIGFKDETGFDIDIAQEDYEGYDSLNYSGSKLSYGDCVMLRNNNFPEWKNFTGDLFVESAADTVSDRLKEIEWYKIASRYAKSLMTASASVNDDFDYYLPSKDYEKLEDYNQTNHEAKIRFDLDGELRDLRIYLGAKLKISYKNWPDLKLKCFPIDNKLKLEIEDNIGKLCSIGTESYYNYDEDSTTNRAYVRYNISETKKIILQANADSYDTRHFENSVLLKYVLRF